MKSKFTVIFICFLFPLVATKAEDQVLREKISNLNQQSIELLGISLNALAYLVDASPNSYMPVRYLYSSSNINYIRELEKNKYVRTEISQGLPSGRQMNEEFMRVIPLGLGNEAQRCLIALQHNKSLKNGTAKNAAP